MAFRPGNPRRDRHPMVRAVVWTIGLAALLALGVTASHAQQVWRGGFGGYTPPRYPTRDSFAGAFNFCRLQFTSNRREKRGWDTDYPGADINFSVRLGELTRTHVTMSAQGEGDEPEYVVVHATDEALFQCPFVLMEDGGTVTFSDQEVIRLREYLQKGGFLLSADYWGTLAREQFDEEIGRVLPRARYPIIDLTSQHPIWHTLF